MNRFICLLCLILFCAWPVAAQPKRGFQPADLYALRDVSDAQVSPDGSRVVYTVSEISPDHRRTISHLWIVPTAGGEPKRLTSDEASESTARWSPDGRLIAFYSDRDRQNGLWVVNADGTAPQLVAHIARTNSFLTRAGESFTWSPDSKRIAFLTSPESVTVTARIATNGATNSAMAGIPERLRRPLTVEEINQLPPEIRDLILRAQGRLPGSSSNNAAAAPTVESGKTASDDPRVITRLQYKSRTAFSDNLQSHIFIGYPWDNYDLLWERSPLKHIKKAKTPLLLIHGEQDNDVHITQAEEMYTALRMRGVETVLVRYPREGHGLREPEHRVDSLNRTIEWFDRHLK